VEVRIQAIVTGAPGRRFFFRMKTNYGKIVGPRRFFPKARKIFSNVDSRMLSNNRFALIHRKNGSQHPLILCVWLAKVEVGHT